jgi:hypothetical protein
MFKKIIQSLVVVVCFLVFLTSFNNVNAYGDGYTDCERDKIYERNAKGHPVMGLRLRERACMTDSAVITVLPEGVEVDVIAETDGWYKVKDKNGSIGWVGARLMKITQTSSIGNKLGGEHYSLNIGKGASEADRKKMFKRVQGNILLQVEQKGEAWYVDPVSEKRFYMRDGITAFGMMRSFGLGINNANFESLESGNTNLLDRLAGRIVLRVEEKGEAYYIHPAKKTLHYLKNGDEAYKIMRELGLGISNKDLEMILK